PPVPRAPATGPGSTRPPTSRSRPRVRRWGADGRCHHPYAGGTPLGAARTAVVEGGRRRDGQAHVSLVRWAGYGVRQLPGQPAPPDCRGQRIVRLSHRGRGGAEAPGVQGTAARRHLAHPVV